MFQVQEHLNQLNYAKLLGDLVSKFEQQMKANRKDEEVKSKIREENEAKERKQQDKELK